MYHFQTLDHATNTWHRVFDVGYLTGVEELLELQGQGGDMEPWETWTLTSCLEVRDHTIANWQSTWHPRGIRVVDDDGHVIDYDDDCDRMPST